MLLGYDEFNFRGRRDVGAAMETTFGYAILQIEG